MNWRPTRRNETRLGGQRAPMLYPLFHFSREIVSAKWTRDDVQSPSTSHRIIISRQLYARQFIAFYFCNSIPARLNQFFLFHAHYELHPCSFRHRTLIRVSFCPLPLSLFLSLFFSLVTIYLHATRECHVCFPHRSRLPTRKTVQ